MVGNPILCCGIDATLTLLDPSAAELARELDGLPLALATADAYLDQVAATFVCTGRHGEGYSK